MPFYFMARMSVPSTELCDGSDRGFYFGTACKLSKGSEGFFEVSMKKSSKVPLIYSLFLTFGGTLSFCGNLDGTSSGHACMACFKSFQEGFMTILNDPTDKVENGTTLTVHPAFLGAWALQYEPIGDVLHLPQWAIETNCKVIGSKSDSHALLLQSAHHDEETDQPTPFSLLGHRIQTEEAV
ncbi:hypothetical protein RHSIM_Rhsim11G0065300 [Rhododendron simsii]|uniref:Uncharacterized protein n=1 Tax=Rhododendron simsii TaxID=118357 RepID=A0A834LBH9_RHOSS|nr:hypothetical protein RHSIM_Rhsim11G0065300 [Rhododendron simsii]